MGGGAIDSILSMPFDCPNRKPPVRTPTLLILIRNYLFCEPIGTPH